MGLIINSSGSACLDLLRAAAALAVFIGHLRSLFIVDYSQSVDRGSMIQAAYFITALGHQAVTAFFVLSGFFIASSVTRRLDRWSWREYLIDRLARLHVVLIPALVATVAWDSLGLQTGRDAAVYQGTTGTAALQFSVADRLTPSGFAASACYCQTILAPPLGSNGPLWSLANEFWYYILFPALALIVYGRSVGERLIHLLLAGAVALFVGPSVLILFPIWLMGAAVSGIGRVRCLSARGYRILAWVAALAAAGVLLLIGTNRLSGLAADYLFGGALAVWVYATAHDTRPVDRSRAARTFQLVAVGLASFSYTLYLTHFPFLVYIRSQLMIGSRWQLRPDTAVWLSVVSVGVLLYAWVFARFTEGQTHRLRRWLRGRFVQPAQEVHTRDVLR